MYRYATFSLLVISMIASTLTGIRAEEVKVLSWNIEIGGSDPAVIQSQLETMRGTFDILALSEVPEDELKRFGSFFQSDSFIAGRSGDNACLLIAWNGDKLEMVDHQELLQWNNIQLAQNSLNPPLVSTFKVKGTDRAFQLVNNHFIRGSAQRRNQQAEAMVGWAEKQTIPVVAVGDYNMDYDFPTEKGNAAFDIMLKGNVFQWVKPTKLIDTNWADRDKDGMDDYPDSMLSFTFTAHYKWKCSVNVIVRDGDFPDDKTTSDHRPTLTTIEIN
jgi:hypothetical protein